jgi:hypothetical protein
MGLFAALVKAGVISIVKEQWVIKTFSFFSMQCNFLNGKIMASILKLDKLLNKNFNKYNKESPF